MSKESESQDRSEPAVGIGDDQLPEDLVPSDDNPLAERAEDAEQVKDLLDDGKSGERTVADGPGGLGSTADGTGDTDGADSGQAEARDGARSGD